MAQQEQLQPFAEPDATTTTPGQRPAPLSRMSARIMAAADAMRDVEMFLREEHSSVMRSRAAVDEAMAEVERARADVARQFTDLAKQRAAFERERDLCRDHGAATSREVRLNVGGVHLTTTRDTLCRVRGTMLEAMFSGRHRLATDASGRFLIDRDPALFAHVLAYLRDGALHLPEDEDERFAVLNEFDFFCLPISDPLVRERSPSSRKTAGATSAITREEVDRLSCTGTLSIHDNSVVCMRVWGDLLASSAIDGRVKLFSLSTGLVIRELVGHTGALWCLQFFSRESQLKLVSASSDRTLRVWDVDSGVCEHVLIGHQDNVRWVESLDGDTLVSTGSDRTVRFWSLSSEMCTKMWEAHDRAIIFLQVVRDLVVTASFDNSIKVWNASTCTLIRQLNGHTGAVVALQAFYDGTRVASSSYDGTAKVWDLENGNCLQTFVGHGDVVRTLSVIRGELLVTGGQDGTVRVWDIATGACLKVLAGHVGLVWAVTTWRSAILSAGADHNIKLWTPSPAPAPATAPRP